MAENDDRSDDNRTDETRRRHMIYVILMLVVVAALILPFRLEFPYAQEAVDCHRLIEELPERPRVFVVADFSATTDRAEGDRQLRAILGQSLDRRATVVVATVDPRAAQADDTAVRQALDGRGLNYGDAAVHLGSGEGGARFVFDCAADFVRAAGGRDHRGEDLNLMPLLHSFRWLGAGNLLVWVSDGTGLPLETAVALAGQYGVLSLAAGSGTAGARAVELMQDGRFSAALPGGRATADYEALCAGRASAARQHFALTLGTLFVLGLIVWAYVAGWLGRLRRRGGRRDLVASGLP